MEFSSCLKTRGPVFFAEQVYSSKSIKAVLWELTLSAQINYLAVLLMISTAMSCAGKCTAPRDSRKQV